MASAPLKFFSFHSIPKLSVTQWKRHNSAINAYIFLKITIKSDSMTPTNYYYLPS